MTAFPYEPRRSQEEILDTIYFTLKEGKNLILESGTGSGKTVCALAPSIEYSMQHGKRVLYLTRTHSQQRQVVHEAEAIREHVKNTMNEEELGLKGAHMEGERPFHGKNDESSDFYVVPILGRQRMCTLSRELQDFQGASPEELSLMCSDRKRASIEPTKGKNDDRGCPFYRKTLKTDINGIKSWYRSRMPQASEFIDYCEEKGTCPYECNKLIAADALVVTAPYIFFFNPFIRSRLLEWMGCTLEDLILIIDEAHNLPDYLRDLFTIKLGSKTLSSARKEAEDHHDPKFQTQHTVSTLCEALDGIISQLALEYLEEEGEDGFMPPDALESNLMSYFAITSNQLRGWAASLVEIGEVVRQKKRAQGKLARSFIHAVGDFLMFWMEVEEADYIKLVVGLSEPGIEAYCLSPARAASDIDRLHASIHMSGTLNPLDQYRDSLGLNPQETLMRTFPSPFPEENRALIYTPDVTTKYQEMVRDSTLKMRIVEHINTVLGATKRNTAIFFPSFSLQEELMHHGLEISGRGVFIDDRCSGSKDLLELLEGFKNSHNGLLLSVIGGRISEGMDFPDKDLELVVIVGIPYPKPTARQRALEHYYEVKFRRGWEYAVKGPTTRRLLQAIGRLIRSEGDRGVVIILDRRAIQFKEHLKGLKECSDIVKDVKEFFLRPKQI